MKTIAKAFAISALTVCAAGAAQAATVTTLMLSGDRRRASRSHDLASGTPRR